MPPILNQLARFGYKRRPEPGLRRRAGPVRPQARQIWALARRDRGAEVRGDLSALRARQRRAEAGPDRVCGLTPALRRRTLRRPSAAAKRRAAKASITSEVFFVRAFHLVTRMCSQ